MRQRILLITSLLFTTSVSVYAQPQSFLEGKSNVKLQDVIKEYQQSKQTFADNEDEEEVRDRKRKKVVAEKHDYHFDRWLWYWSSHTDADGYLVSPVKNYEEWQKYIAGRSMAKSTATSNANWVFQGPTTSNGGYEGVGRIQNIEFHPTDPNTYWVCTGGGGVWKTTNNGVSWTSITESLPVLGASDLKANPKNPNTLYLCTGDRDASDTYSIGVMKSTDGGNTWVATGISWTKSQYMLANSLMINKVDTNSLTLAASDGIYKSYNGGTSWTKVQSGNFKQVLYHPTDTSILYAATYNGSANAQIFRSANGGATWTQVTSFSSTKRITLAVTPANVAIVKAVVANTSNGLNGVYNSSDTGKTFIKIFGPTGCTGDILSSDNKATPTNCGKQGWYDLSIAIDPNNANKVFVGGVNTHYSINGGTSWTITTQWYSQMAGVATVHADKHWLAFHPLVANRLFECNDGGVYRTDNPLPTSVWNDLTHTMGITQFYRNAATSNTTFVLGGAQDNGTKMYQGGAWVSAGGGDGMDCQIDFVDSNTFYTAVQYGDIDRHSSTLGDANISNNIPGNMSGKGPWITPYIINPNNNMDLIAGYKNVYYSGDAGDNWIDLFNKPLDANKSVNRIAMTPANDSVIYMITDDNNGKIYFTNTFSPWVSTDYDSIQYTSTSYDITDIEVDTKKKDRFWITFGGYNSPQVVEYNAGVWTTNKTGLPNVPVHCFERDSSNDIIYVGTDIGVFYQDTATGLTWTPYNKNMPSIEVTDLAINYNKQELWASTYGRGMWKTLKQDYVTPHDTDTTNIVAAIPFVSDGFTIVPNPSNGHFNVRTTTAALFSKQITVLIVDNAGRMVLNRKYTFGQDGTMNIDLPELSKGIYIFEAVGDSGVIGRKRIIINQ